MIFKNKTDHINHALHIFKIFHHHFPFSSFQFPFSVSSAWLAYSPENISVELLSLYQENPHITLKNVFFVQLTGTFSDRNMKGKGVEMPEHPLTKTCSDRSFNASGTLQT